MGLQECACASAIALLTVSRSPYALLCGVFTGHVTVTGTGR